MANLLCSILLENENPEAAGEEEENGEHLVKGRQGHLPDKKHSIFDNRFQKTGDIRSL